MKFKYIIMLLFVSLLSLTVKAQQNMIRGSVVETGTNTKMPDVFVRNTSNNQVTLTDNTGNFQIRAIMGNILVFSSPGYVSDTLYIADMAPKRIIMTPLGIALREVNVRGQRFDPRAEYPQVYQKSKVYVLSPTSWFGKEAKDARRLKHYFEREEKERRIDSVFTKVYVGSLVPLKGQDLEVFMNLFRPTYEFVRSNNGESMAAYINDSYKKYMALPPEKRVVPKLTAN
jgi:ribosomal protein S11